MAAEVILIPMTCSEDPLKMSHLGFKVPAFARRVPQDKMAFTTVQSKPHYFCAYVEGLIRRGAL